MYQVFQRNMHAVCVPAVAGHPSLSGVTWMQFQELAGPQPTPCSQAAQLPKSAPSGAVSVCACAQGCQAAVVAVYLLIATARLAQGGGWTVCVLCLCSCSCSNAAVWVVLASRPSLFTKFFAVSCKPCVSGNSAGDTLLLACGFLFANWSDPWPGSSSQANREGVHASAHSSLHVAVACLGPAGPESRWDMPCSHDAQLSPAGGDMQPQACMPASLVGPLAALVFWQRPRGSNLRVPAVYSQSAARRVRACAG